jgi:3-phenylpropionate/trans-cinnamate dioxygenase ferredoxin component
VSTRTVRVCALDDVDDGGSASFEVDGRTVAVIRLGGDVYVIGDRCSHANVSLGAGEVDPDECTVECPKHGSEFDLRTGEALSLPAVKPVPTYEASVVDGDVMLELT